MSWCMSSNGWLYLQARNAWLPDCIAPCLLNDCLHHVDPRRFLGFVFGSAQGPLSFSFLLSPCGLSEISVRISGKTFCVNATGAIQAPVVGHCCTLLHKNPRESHARAILWSEDPSELSKVTSSVSGVRSTFFVIV